MKIIFMGTPNFAVPILRSIYDSGHKILEVYTQPATKSGRGQKINHSDIFKFAEQLNLKVRSPDTLETVEEIDHIKKLKPDLVVVVAYGKILPTKLLNIDKITFINAHASLLPKWRGAAPIQRAIMNMDSETGVSVMKIIPQLDAGPVMLQGRIKISQKMSYEDLSKKMSEIAAKLILESIKLIENNNAIFVEQKESEVTYAKKIQKNEGKIDWNDNAEKIIGKINGLYPYPGAFFSFNGERYKILKAEKANTKGKAGDVISENFEVCCGEGSIKVLKIQREGKRIQQISEFLLGSQIKKGFNIT